MGLPGLTAGVVTREMSVARVSHSVVPSILTLVVTGLLGFAFALGAGCF
jgi:hypothetical protein